MEEFITLVWEQYSWREWLQTVDSVRSVQVCFPIPKSESTDWHHDIHC